jgi:hypothetical protein
LAGLEPKRRGWSSLEHLELNHQGERTMSLFSFVKEAGEKLSTC